MNKGEELAHAYGLDITEVGEMTYLVAGGKLIYKEWITGEEDANGIRQDGHYEYNEVTDPIEVCRHAFDIIEFGRGVKLVDVFKFVIANPILQPVVGKYCLEHCLDGVNNLVSAEELVKIDLTYPLEYLEIYRIGSISEYSKYYIDDSVKDISKHHIQDRFPDFHGVAYPLKERDPVTEFPAGYRVNCGVGFSKARYIADLPLILNIDYKIYDDTAVTINEPIAEFTRGYTLIEILKAIFWEMGRGDYGTDEEVIDAV
jgi:hypothetical protein